MQSPYRTVILRRRRSSFSYVAVRKLLITTARTPPLPVPYQRAQMLQKLTSAYSTAVATDDGTAVFSHRFHYMLLRLCGLSEPHRAKIAPSSFLTDPLTCFYACVAYPNRNVPKLCNKQPTFMSQSIKIISGKRVRDFFTPDDTDNKVWVCRCEKKRKGTGSGYTNLVNNVKQLHREELCAAVEGGTPTDSSSIHASCEMKLPSGHGGKFL